MIEQCPSTTELPEQARRQLGTYGLKLLEAIDLLATSDDLPENLRSTVVAIRSAVVDEASHDITVAEQPAQVRSHEELLPHDIEQSVLWALHNNDQFISTNVLVKSIFGQTKLSVEFFRAFTELLWQMDRDNKIRILPKLYGLDESAEQIKAKNRDDLLTQRIRQNVPSPTRNPRRKR